MTTLDFWFDPVSPYVWLAFDRLPQELQGLNVVVRYRPVLFAGLLKAHGHKGPAEIPGKREFTYRQVDWLAQRQGTPLQLPQPHPYNPLALLRLALASAPAEGPLAGQPSRRTVELILRHAWCASGADPNDPVRLAALRAAVAEQAAPLRDPDSAEVKAQLRAATDAAIAQGLFGVPTCVPLQADGRPGPAFWGQDALPMLRDHLLQAAPAA
jgi:2-hydroxychromene-2-carboxylate isomerase